MNKYELAVVLTTKIEDEERAASIEKIKEVIARFGGVVTNVDEWGKKRLAYEIQKMKEVSTTSSLSNPIQTVQTKLNSVSVLWRM